ncbi:family 20 glycosylhydrolase [Chitinophaga pollutisoli]|uniref:beta-N-acetylhexosaminidase n=1 Tax=Chitinophaga pollutisoli TaxID=3133966 RepID=A0ABZ2YQJ8_9BACT
MKMKAFIGMWLMAVLTAATVYAVPAADTSISVIPAPQHVRHSNGQFTLNAQTRIVAEPGDEALQQVARDLADAILRQSGLRLKVTAGKSAASNVIILRLRPDTLGDEGYRLRVQPGLASITASRPAGAFYAMQTLLQLLPVQARAKPVLPVLEIIDSPRFGWRGLMLDVGRYYYPVSYIKQYLDYMAMHKLNTFHWHLTEDHGWRIEIKKYPRLTAVGAWRNGTQITNNRINHQPHGGFYTQEEVKEVVAYAQSKFITVVPEIEMPGHSMAALAAYPELSCTGGPFEMPVNWGIRKEVFCAGNEKTFAFLEDVLSEVAELFPGQTIHIGGDECPKDRWKACARCQERIKSNKLKDEHELQSYFITRIEKFLQSKGKRIIGWDEILEGGLAPNAAVMSWRGTQGGIQAAKLLHPVVMTPNHFMYFDYYQGEHYLEPYCISGFVPLRKVYDYEPVPAELTPEESRFILGVQANIWCEYIHSPERATYMTFPRAAALAETGWSSKNRKQWDDFTRRMETQYLRYEQAGIGYAASAYNVAFSVQKDSARNKAVVTLQTDSYLPEIRYTLNGDEPTAASLPYNQPFEVEMPVNIRAAVFRNGKLHSKVSATAILRNSK